MTNPMSHEELRASRERAEVATAGPWRVGSVETWHVFVPCSTCIGPERVLLRFNEHFLHGADAAFIAKARTDVPRLLATIAARDAQLEAVGAVLSENGCDCDRDHPEEECDDECDHGDPCLACRIEAAMKGAKRD